ncbi:LPXTG-motif cell wall anchor domain-containing protein [Micromonospora citrea]|uniref:LPXTG-motif cell wall anchor domain-containing protein n=1 Tax=Micromonospora citrea TaxID=47855 RepID=A0A1C6UVL2_9ACTN|nr:LPXTG cell wall anchor domain-containing protein [Micromonospora citrea]SCL58038.1 LPXTG-motif cell wall anchor domain-containing protein [Micromonospora citrea]
MTMHHRPLARLGAVALLASGAFTAVGTPAHAAGSAADLTVTAVVGTKVAEGTRIKTAYAKVTNNGPGTPSALVVKADTSKVDHYGEVAFLPAAEGCSGEGAAKPVLWTCVVPEEQIPGPGETLELPIVMIKRVPDVDEPYTAPVTLTVESPDDTTADNNSATVQIEISKESGVDLGVVVPDVTRQLAFDDVLKENPPTEALNPGDATTVLAFIENQGDRIADGLDLKIALPKGVTFDDGIQVKECEYAADLRSADCRAGLLQLAPGEGVLGAFPVEVAAGVKAPVSLTGGEVSLRARGELAATEANLARKRSSLPSFLHRPAGSRAAQAGDVDPTDNRDDFAVVVAAAGTGGGGQDGGDEDGGPLPVTGAQTGLVVGIGGAVLVAGAAMFLSARRRRVVLVTPGDEKPTA